MLLHYLSSTGYHELVTGKNGTIGVMMYDGNGNVITVNNPLPVSATVNVGSITANNIDPMALLTPLATQRITITQTPVAPTSPKSNPVGLVVKNLDQVLIAKIGESGMTPANGKGIDLEPQEKVLIPFSPNTSTAVYFYVDGPAIQLEVAWI